MALRDLMSRLLAAICSAARPPWRGDAALIERPVSLPAGKVDLTLHGNTRTGPAAFLEARWDHVDRETLSFGVDVGVRDNVQLGLAVALPSIRRGFGSVVGSVGIAGDQSSEGVFDFGYERIGQNGGSGEFHDDRFMGGIGVLFKARSAHHRSRHGRMGAIQFGHFRNLGSTKTLYLGSTSFFTTCPRTC